MALPDEEGDTILVGQAQSPLLDRRGGAHLLMSHPPIQEGNPFYTPYSAIRNSPCYHFSTMAVNPELLKILVCPLCKASLETTNSGQGLKCTKCHRVYPIRDDIPVMMISEAKIED
jgi:uncharacterized protein YbaR (Trm112 family)